MFKASGPYLMRMGKQQPEIYAGRSVYVLADSRGLTHIGSAYSWEEANELTRREAEKWEHSYETCFTGDFYCAWNSVLYIYTEPGTDESPPVWVEVPATGANSVEV